MRQEAARRFCQKPGKQNSGVTTSYALAVKIRLLCSAALALTCPGQNCNGARLTTWPCICQRQKETTSGGRNSGTAHRFFQFDIAEERKSLFHCMGLARASKLAVTQRAAWSGRRPPGNSFSICWSSTRPCSTLRVFPPSAVEVGPVERRDDEEGNDQIIGMLRQHEAGARRDHIRHSPCRNSRHALTKHWHGPPSAPEHSEAFTRVDRKILNIEFSKHLLYQSFTGPAFICARQTLPVWAIRRLMVAVLPRPGLPSSTAMQARGRRVLPHAREPSLEWGNCGSRQRLTLLGRDVSARAATALRRAWLLPHAASLSRLLYFSLFTGQRAIAADALSRKGLAITGVNHSGEHVISSAGDIRQTGPRSPFHIRKGTAATVTDLRWRGQPVAPSGVANATSL